MALITGAARGQGRAHAVRLAADGADIVAVDVCVPTAVKTVTYELATPDDLDETARLVRAEGRQVSCVHADVRDADAMRQAVADALARFGRLDIVVANAGVLTTAPSPELTDQQWQDMFDVNVHGVWHTVQPAIQPMIDAGGGVIVMTSSTAGEKGLPGLPHYSAAKHAVIGLMKALAVELGRHSIRVNAVLPAAADTAMVHNEPTYRLFRPDLAIPTRTDFEQAVGAGNALPIPLVAPEDVADAVAYLVSPGARSVTGMSCRVDAGALIM